jgi:hypothetical protein
MRDEFIDQFAVNFHVHFVSAGEIEIVDAIERQHAMVDDITAAHGKPIEIWFQDEARIGQKGTLTRLWARIGSQPRARATAATNGPTCSAPSVHNAPWALPW